jgi:DNA-binding CsgD family transcriptional regulator
MTTTRSGSRSSSPAGARDRRAVFVRHLSPFELPGVLSRSERAIVRLTLTGRTTTEIAVERGTSARTVANQLSAIRKKLGVTSFERPNPGRDLREIRRGRAFWLRVLAGELRIKQIVRRGDELAVRALRSHATREVLSPREKEILALATSGCRIKEISKELGIAPTSVQTHIRRGLGKLRVFDRHTLEVFGLVG